MDFDGVMLRNQAMTMYQNKKSAMFVQKHTGMSLKACEVLNADYYPKYGHTVIMMNKLFNKDLTLQDYNNFVFDEESLKSMIPLLDTKTVSHYHTFDTLITKCEDKLINTCVFTNAPYVWVNTFQSVLSNKQLPVIYPKELSLLKPNASAYDAVETSYPLCNTFWFLDDSKGNLHIPEQRMTWVPLHYRPNMTIKFMEDYFGV